MLRPVIDLFSCQACQPCSARFVCDTKAIIKIDYDEPPFIAIERCSGCCACVLACSYQAISMQEVGANVGAGCRGLRI